MQEDYPQRINMFGEEVEKQFSMIGQQLKEEMLREFESSLSKDTKDIRNILRRFINNNQRVIRNSERELMRVLGQQLGNNSSRASMGESVLSTAFGGIRNENIRSTDFKQSSAQILMEIGRAVARSTNRNG